MATAAAAVARVILKGAVRRYRFDGPVWRLSDCVRVVERQLRDGDREQGKNDERQVAGTRGAGSGGTLQIVLGSRLPPHRGGVAH